MTAGPAPVLWLCGPADVGKSTVGWEIFVQVRQDGITAAYLDLSQVGFCRPAPGDDTHRLRARNLGAMWPVFRAAGARCLILSGEVASREVLAMYAGAIPATALTVCRLRAGRDELTRRILLRGRGDGPAIPGDELRGQPAGRLRLLAEQAARDGDDLECAGLGGLAVATDGQPPAELARLIRGRAGGWPGPC